MKRKKFLQCVLVTFTLILLSGCNKAITEDDVRINIPEYEKNEYATETVCKDTIVPITRLTLKPDNFEIITYTNTYETMTVKDLVVENGQRVKAGDLLVSFENDTIEKSVKEYEKRKAEDEIILEHYNKLLNIETKEEEKSVYIDEINKIQADINITDVYIREKKELINNYRVYAEKPGIITMISDEITKGYASVSKPMFKIASGSSIYTTKTEEECTLKEGDVLTASCDDVLVDMTVIGVTNDGQYTYIEFEPAGLLEGIDESDELTIEIEKTPIKDALYVNEEAVNNIDGKTFVFVVDDNGYRDVCEVTISNIIDGKAIIAEGIEEGKKVIVE